MKKENLSDALNNINDDIIEKVDSTRQINKKYRAFRIMRTGIAACLALAISLTTITIIRNNFPTADDLTKPSIPDNTSDNSTEQSTPDNTIDPNLPILDATMIFGDAGFEGYMLHDISELVNANPWNEDCDMKTLPVYQNTLDAKEYFDIDADIEKMNSLITDVAERFGLKRNEYEITTDSRAYTESLFVITNDFQIRVDPDLSATIELNPSISLPPKYNFSRFANYDDKFAVAEYLKEEYDDIIKFDSPMINITGGDYNIYNQQSYDIEFFDNSGDITQDIINYTFYRVAFYCNVENQLYMIRIFQPDLSQKIGDYPIITKEDATELLSNGNYATSVPPDYKMNVKNIKKVELVYRNAYWLDKIYMPYYRFYIELPELENRQGHGEKTYGAYYVPAVDGKYLKNMPVYDGSFN